MRKSPWILVGAGVTIAAFYLSSTSVRQDGVDTVKESVRTDFRVRKGITLTDVGFVRKNENELHGFAAFQIGLRQVVKACIASRGNDEAQYQWNCY
jgi:hypothetical protein